MSFKSFLISVTLALMAGCLAGYWFCHTQWTAKENRINESQARQETERLEKAMVENRNLHEAVSQMQIRMKKENDNAQRKYDILLARINRGDVRVSVPARAGSGVSGSGHPGVNDGKDRCELDPSVVGRILSVGRDGDAAIRNMNQCIDQYHALEKRFNRS